ncbi:DUF488 domain-containing protein [Thermus composti]|uniref:DUF488 domain-containing protein n=1 Tax=Thermus composti TaxID=532059 RepID=A0ABV6PYL9_9DEIN|nr:DUF488 family protein [Thermus composti]
MPFRTKRVYDPPSPEDGLRVLVDRIWPRGLSKEKARVDWWAKELPPSNALRRWFAHDPGKYLEFLRRYREELKGNPALARLQALGKEGTVTLLFGAKETRYNNAQALLAILKEESLTGGGEA